MTFYTDPDAIAGSAFRKKAKNTDADEAKASVSAGGAEDNPEQEIPQSVEEIPLSQTSLFSNDSLNQAVMQDLNIELQRSTAEREQQQHSVVPSFAPLQDSRLLGF